MSEAVLAVVVAHNSEAHLDGLLDSLPAAFDSDPYEVVVVDNGSTDGTVELLERRGDARIIRSGNDGYAAAINRAVRESGPCGYVLVLNPDATLDPQSVPRMQAVASASGAGVVAPRVREADGRLSYTIRRAPSLGRVGGLSFTGLAPFTERVERDADYESEHVVDWAVGAILLIDSDCFSQLGGFDESYFLYSEETDFCLRARDAGWSTVYTPAAGGMHIGGGSGENVTTHTMKILNRVRLYRRRSDAPRAFVYLLATVAIECKRAIGWRGATWKTVRALVRPSQRPPVLGLGDRLIPR